jgi:glyoxylase-like metal-dependent hydrolase (beta-lactamase superfamily II)/rhodanese-related sulfurtransferase
MEFLPVVEVIPVRDDGLGNSAYLVDLGDGGALLVDPQRILGPYLDAADRRGLRVRFVAETHLHADFVSGSRELVAAGAQLLLPAAGDYAFDHRGLRDHDEVDVGGLTLRVIATPGHTPEHLAYLLLDGGEPVALFSGGTLMAGGVARPDLISPAQTEPLARAAWRSITDRLLSLPDDLPVFPTHGGGSFCSAGTSGETATTIGRERAANPLLQAADEDDFVTRLLDGLGTFPEYFLHLREVNRRGPQQLGPTLPSLARLAPNALASAASDDGAAVVDARPIDRFAAGHVPGSISIELRNQFASWLGWVVAFDTPVAVVLDDQDERDLVAQALTIGYDRLVGRLDGGIAAWQAAGRPVRRIPLLAPGDALDGRRVVDVRQTAEWDAGHVPGAVHAEAGSILDHLPDLTGPVVTHCGHGQRAMTAASLLARAGHADVAATTAGPDQLTARPEPAR